MMKKLRKKLTLDRPVPYQITVPGVLDKSWPDWDARLVVDVAGGVHGLPITTVSAVLDQAALHGLLRRLYALGLPLISVIWLEDGRSAG